MKTRFSFVFVIFFCISCGNSSEKKSVIRAPNKDSLFAGEVGVPLKTADYDVTVKAFKQLEEIPEMDLPVMNDSAYVALTLNYKNRSNEKKEIDCGILGLYNDSSDVSHDIHIYHRARCEETCTQGINAINLGPFEEKTLHLVFVIQRGIPGMLMYMPTTDLNRGINLCRIVRRKKPLGV